MNNINSVKQDKNCTGCKACESICPVGCIEFKADEEGFLQPFVDEHRCINCKVCLNKCPQHNTSLNNNDNNIDIKEKKVYAVKLKDEKLLEESSSGGVFSAVAIHILKNNGVVFGCAFDDNIVANHMCIKSIEDLHLLRGSKYVQSDTKETYKSAKEYLDKGIKVLYSGTPCQIAGLKAFLNKDYDNLITIDLICHGVPSPKLFREYLNSIEKKKKTKVISYEFRYKGKMGHGLYNRIRTEKGDIVKAARCDSYYQAFLDKVGYRECCFSCKYANLNRIADITLGDFWGLDKLQPKINGDRGISVVLVNSQKGKDIFKLIDDLIIKYDSNIEEAVFMQTNLKQPSSKPSNHEAFNVDFVALGYDVAISNHVKVKGPLTNFLALNISRSFRKKIRVAVSKLRGNK